MGRTTAKFFALAATTAALVVFGPSMAQAATSTPAASAVSVSIAMTTTDDGDTDDNNPWD